MLSTVDQNSYLYIKDAKSYFDEPREKFCGGREKVGKSNNFKNELTMFTP
jgi:hypothetical protein